MKEAVQEPSASAKMREATGVPSTLTAMSLSLLAKPRPVTVRDAPGSTRLALRDTAGVSIKGTCRSRVEPGTPMEYVPFGAGGIVNVVVQEPRASAEAEATTVAAKVMEMPIWLAPKPSPAIVSKEPGGPVG